MAKLLTLSSNLISDSKEQMKYIYEGYINAMPLQSNLFRDIYRTHRNDFLDNVDDVERQMDAIRSSLYEIYSRYGYVGIELDIRFEEINEAIVIDITATNRDGITNKLSETLILEDY